MDFRPIFPVIGILLTILAVVMCLPAAVDFTAGSTDWQVFAISAGVTLFVGVSMTLTSRAGGTGLSVRQAFLMVTLSWLSLTIFASLPLAFSELGLSFTDAFFEAMSGITTTGSTVLTGLDTMSPGILLWRALLQWLGGLGIIVMAIAVLPMLGVGGMQLFRVEAFDTGEGKVLPRAAQISAALSIIYILLTAIVVIALWLAGMTGFEAVVHSMTALSTGGFSTSDGSIGYFDSATIDVVTIIAMILGSLPFLLYLKMLRGDLGSVFRESQVWWFFTIVAILTTIAAGWLWLDGGMHPAQAARYAAFNIISIITGTGFATTDYTLWGSFAAPIFFFIMFIGGCAGSTTCGIKIFRFQVLYSAARTQIHHLLQPHGVFIPYYNRRPIPDEVIVSVLSFFFVFFLSFTALALGLGMLGLDFLTAVSSAATAISNVGPALGPIVGPAGSFQLLPDAAKWLMAGGMLLGRLELFTIIVLFTRSFWRG